MYALQNLLENQYMGRKVMNYLHGWWAMGNFIKNLGKKYDCELPLGNDLYSAIKKRDSSLLIVDRDKDSDRANKLVEELLYFYWDCIPIVICSAQYGSKYKELIPSLFIHDTDDEFVQMRQIQNVINRCKLLRKTNQEDGNEIKKTILIMDVDHYSQNLHDKLAEIMMIYRHIDLVPIVISRLVPFRPVIRTKFDFFCLFESTVREKNIQTYNRFCGYSQKSNGIIRYLGENSLILDRREENKFIIWKNHHFSTNMIRSKIKKNLQMKIGNFE